MKQLRALMKALDDHGFDEVSITNDDQSIKLKRRSQATVSAAPAVTTVAPAVQAPASGSSAPAENQVGELITSPFVGTFYGAPSPDAPPFVKVGSSITQGSVLCIVEAMKLMNEIEAEISGEILEVLVENGKPVEYGDPLFRVKKSG